MNTDAKQDPAAQTITITAFVERMFKGHSGHLRQLRKALSDRNNKETFKALSAKHIEPIIGDISKNCGQEMVPGYVGYMVQFQISNPHHKMPLPSGAKDGEAAKLIETRITPDQLQPADNFSDFIIFNAGIVVSDLIAAAEAVGIYFKHNHSIKFTEFYTFYTLLDTTTMLPLPLPDNAFDGAGHPIRERVEHWVVGIMRAFFGMFAAKNPEAAQKMQDEEDAKEAAAEKA
jgi:hypothetical protein